MPRFILILLSFIAIALIITGIIAETVPSEQLQVSKTIDPISCSCNIPQDDYTLIAKGIITDIRYITRKNGATDVTFFVDGEPMTLNFDKTRSSGGPYGFYSEIYGADANGNIENGKYYHIYNYGDRIIWSQTPKVKQ